ncbi:MAPEG family protein [Sphingobium sp. BYY-5]|uniref:MAPEG family protein n=1 Tax=Sphingobium sp. BYY-5 TaxID=2926400 RepID=UPI001FA74F5E|nr:MAPEG family protein [Sphingobium sp. BYY-5]MCI4592245.1 MAPEG family protein [Sphingobium sp. BYY-5]
MAILPITSILAAAFAVALVALSFPISLRRLKVGDMVGGSADEVLHRRIRAQGNFIEYVPLGLVSLGLVEAHAAPIWIILAIGTMLVLGRALHAFGMLADSGPVRGFGMIFTYLALLGAAGRLIVDVVI